MREIKFRAIYKPDGETKDGYLMFHQIVEQDTSVTFAYKYGIEKEEIIYDFEVPFLDNDWLLMQYTGLKDKNGKEIYEGDVLRDVNYYKPVVVEYDENGFWCKEEDDEVHGWIMPCIENREIIGNLYENPELKGTHDD
jgi:uncharacterized phage protein (TIGR01671 family)